MKNSSAKEHHESINPERHQTAKMFFFQNVTEPQATKKYTRVHKLRVRPSYNL